MDLKALHLYRKFICIFLACYMLVLGIRVAGTQMDSFFTFSKEGTNLIIGRVQGGTEPIGYILKQYNDSTEEIQDKIIQPKSRKIYGNQTMICPERQKKLLQELIGLPYFLSRA